MLSKWPHCVAAALHLPGPVTVIIDPSNVACSKGSVNEPGAALEGRHASTICTAEQRVEPVPVVGWVIEWLGCEVKTGRGDIVVTDRCETPMFTKNSDRPSHHRRQSRRWGGRQSSSK